jgi:hypothetical protein
METILKHRGPHPGAVAGVFALLFITGLSFVVSMTGQQPFFPGPWESAETIATYFQNHPNDVLWCAFFQFGSAIPLGIFTATMTSRIRFLGGRVAGVDIALFGGFFTAFSIVVSSMILWTMSYPGIASDVNVLRALYYLSFAIGGVGYSVPLGLLIAGISVTSFFMKTLPKWLTISGFVLAIVGELSFLTLVNEDFLPLIPLTRFPGFIWLIVAGFRLPNVVTKR